MSQMKDTIERRNQLLHRLQKQQGRAEERNERARDLQVKVEEKFGTSDTNKLREIYRERKKAFDAAVKRDTEVHNVVEQALNHIERGETLPVALLNQIKSLEMEPGTLSSNVGCESATVTDVAEVGRFDAAITDDNQEEFLSSDVAQASNTTLNQISDPLAETMRDANQQKPASEKQSNAGQQFNRFGFGEQL